MGLVLRMVHFARAGGLAAAAWKWQQPPDPAGQTKLMRLIAIPFVIIGPISIVAGLISISQGRIGDSGPGALLSPFR